MPAGSSTPFKFAVFGDWGKTLAAGNPDQANVISQIAASGARFAVTTGDNSYEVGSQKSYGDLYQTGDNTSAVFGPNYWKVAGASLPLFPALGNHDYNNTVLLTNWPQDTAVVHVRRALPDRHVLLPERHDVDGLPERLVRVRRRAGALLRADHGVGRHERRHGDRLQERLRQPLGAQLRRSTSGSRTTSRTHPRALRFAFWHYPLDSDSSEGGPDTYLQGANSLEGLLKLYDVTAGFNGHSHNYQRNTAPSGGIPDPHHRRRRREPGVDRGHRRLQRRPTRTASAGRTSPTSAAPAAPGRSRPPRTACTTSCS